MFYTLHYKSKQVTKDIDLQRRSRRNKVQTSELNGEKITIRNTESEHNEQTDGGCEGHSVLLS